MTGLRPVLVVDSSSGTLERLVTDRGTRNVPLIYARTAKEARWRLVDLALSYSGIFINPQIEEPNGIRMIRLAHERQMGTPIYLIRGEDRPPFEQKELDRLAIQGIVKKPLSYAEICRLVFPLIEGFDSDGALLRAEAGKDEIRLDPPGSVDEQFVPILAHHFLSGRKSFFDLFVRLDSGRYMKLLKAGDEFAPERLETYFRKGVDRFYLRKEAQARYLTYCDQLAEGVMKSRSASAEVKAAATLNLGQETISFLRRQGLLRCT